MNDKTAIPLRQFVWPVLFENLLRTSLMSVDVLMLTVYSQKAVAAVGLIQQFTFFIQLLYLMVTIGASIVISQSLGADRHTEAGFTALASLILASVVAIILSVAVVFTAEPILCLYQLEKDVHIFARQFLVIYGSFSVFVAFNMAQGSILRSWGYSRDPMIVNIIANILNVAGNSLMLFGWFGLPILGVKGVAFSTMFSQFASCIILGIMMWRRKDVELPFKKIRQISWSIYQRILAVGIPTAGEGLSYNISQIVIMNIIAQMGTAAMSAYVYAFTLLRFVFIPSASIGVGAQIKVGYFAGAGRQSEAYLRVYRYAWYGFLITLGMVVFLNLVKPILLPFFTSDPATITLITSVLLVSLIHEPCRSCNLIVIPSLKGSGDVQFPVAMAIIFMWGFGVGFAYIFGVKYHMGLVGVWLGLMLDELLRCIIMFARWRSGAWKNKAISFESPQPAVQIS